MVENTGIPTQSLMIRTKECEYFLFSEDLSENPSSQQTKDTRLKLPTASEKSHSMSLNGHNRLTSLSGTSSICRSGARRFSWHEHKFFKDWTREQEKANMVDWDDLCPPQEKAVKEAMEERYTKFLYDYRNSKTLERRKKKSGSKR